MAKEKALTVREGIGLIGRNADPIAVAEAITDPNLEYPEGSSDFGLWSRETRKEQPKDSTPGAGETGPSDTKDGGKSRQSDKGVPGLDHAKEQGK